ncbi:hypothetical protein GCT13_28135 [Paraburkholderia sp. CNPSo 3157]|uniref:Uncharacterized protein n=1 Tax=Paraburkholderia franconis TaxID=2654983 RepID=A0A7X1NEZ5_9BURK|nr:hypothetical protein [Paraburkholderia franconis]MPW20644.1 hypothetical protein [Paraburkholderia franconis]
MALGIDRNVRDNCIATSDGRQYRLDAVVLERIKRKEIGAKRHQRRMATSQTFVVGFGRWYDSDLIEKNRD